MSKKREVKVGDRVRITDGSQATRVDKYEKYSHIGLSPDEFEVLQLRDRFLGFINMGSVVHDIFIKNTVNGAIYLHSADFVKKVDPPAKEMTVSEISEKLGYEVKVVK